MNTETARRSCAMQVLVHRLQLGQFPPGEAQPAAHPLGGEGEQALVDDVAGLLEIERHSQESRPAGRVPPRAA